MGHLLGPLFLEGDEGSRVERKGGVGVESSTVVCFWRWLIVSLVSSSHFPHDANIWSKQRNAQMEPDKDKENCMLSQVRNACGEMLMFFSLIDHLVSLVCHKEVKVETM